MELLRKRKKSKNKKKTSRFRELTNNERLLLTILAIIILFWLSFKYIIEPQLLKVSNLEEDKINYNEKIEDNNRILKNKEAIIEERNELFLEKTNIEKDFFKSLSQPDIIYILNELLMESDIQMESLSFDKPFIEELNGQEIQKMDISMPFNGNFQSLKEIVLSLEEESRKLVINNIDIQKGEETEIAGNISLGVYSLTGLVETADDNLPIQTTTDNKLNPFIPYEGYVDPNKIAEEETEENKIKESKEETEESVNENLAEQAVATSEYDIYTAAKGDNISYISYRKYGTVKYVDEILQTNGMDRESILPIGKKLKLKIR